MICKTCGNEFFEDWRKDKRTPCEHCSRKCSNVRNASAETKKKTSEKLRQYFQKIEQEGRVCQHCGKVYHSKDLSRKLCFDCLPTTIRRNTKNRVKKVVKTIKDVSSRTAEKIMKRMSLPCSCCGFHVQGVTLDVHHIVPKKEGGTDDMDNLCYICPNCHRIAHTNSQLLKNQLVSLEQQLKDCGKDWHDYYYG